MFLKLKVPLSDMGFLVINTGKWEVLVQHADFDAGTIESGPTGTGYAYPLI